MTLNKKSRVIVVAVMLALLVLGASPKMLNQEFITARAGVSAMFDINTSAAGLTAGISSKTGDILNYNFRVATIEQEQRMIVAEGEEVGEEVSLGPVDEVLVAVPAEAAPPEPVIVEADETMYVTTSLNIREDANTSSEIIDTVPITTPVEITGYVEGQDWAQISYEDQTAYVSTEYLTDTVEHLEYYTYNQDWNGATLQQGVGTVQGPSGKETYYNMPMQGVVRIMQNQLGNYSEYWVRSDGVKMYGDYIMVAANLNVHPRGTLVETSLGTGIVCDTGDFAAYNPTQIDVAVAWGQEYIP